jgi:hypothetical protein
MVFRVRQKDGANWLMQGMMSSKWIFYLTADVRRALNGFAFSVPRKNHSKLHANSIAKQQMYSSNF